jgi:EmrB/QacA subfamily drug resistance transporter
MPARERSTAAWTLAVVAVSTFMLMLDLTVVNVALPDIRSDLDASFTSMQWILDAYALGLATVLLASGSLADRIGRRRVFTGGLVVFVVSSLLCGLAPDDVVLIVARGVQGVGGAVLFAVGPALLGQEYHGKERAKAFGIFGAVAGLAIALGPLIGGALTAGLNWRWIFLINVPLSAVAIVTCVAKLRESRAEVRPALDLLGTAAFSCGLFFLMLGFLRGEADGWSSARIVGSFSIAVVAIVAFVVIQRRRRERAMFDVGLFQSRTFNGLAVVTGLCAASTMPAVFLLISYMQNALGFSALGSGVRFLPLTLMLFAAAVVAGSLVTRAAPALLLGISQLCVAGGLLAVLLIGPDSEWTTLIPAMLLIGAGMGLFNPLRAALSIAVTKPDNAGMASGASETFQQVGLAIGIAAIGALFQRKASAGFESSAGDLLGSSTAAASDAVAAGAFDAATAGAPPVIAARIHNAALQAFVDGLEYVMTAAAILAVVSAAVAFATIRRRDLDESALEHPGVMPDVEPVDREATRVLTAR